LCLPNLHVRAGNLRKLDSTRETLVTLGIIVLKADLEFDGLEEVALLLVGAILEDFLDVGSHSGDSDFTHFGCLPTRISSLGKEFECRRS
jgi:hypothetical protein